MLKKYLIKLLEYVKYKKSYAQDGEDMVLLSFFEHIKNHKGFFVDIGAHHPVRFSNTLFFYKKGWNGINIDPTPGSMKMFNILRSRDINLEIGIGEKKDVLTFFCFNEPALNTFDKQVAEQKNTGKPYHITKTIPVEILPLKDVLLKYLPPKIEIDFFTIDVEGLDLQVLKSNDWEMFAPKYVLVEDNAFNLHDIQASETHCFLVQKGYSLCASLKRTNFYRKDF